LPFMDASLHLPEWVTWLRLPLMVLSVATGDHEGRPSPETLGAIKVHTLLRTDRNGWIDLITDGAQFWVEVEWR